MSYVPVGRIVSTHGLKGEVAFRYYNKDVNNLKQYRSFFAFDGKTPIPLKTRSIKQKGKLFVIKFENIENMEGAQQLLGKELFVREEELPALSEGEFYLYQLSGLSVLNEKDEFLGKVEGSLEKKGVPTLIVSGREEIFVPFVEDFIIQIDLEKKIMKIREDLLRA